MKDKIEITIEQYNSLREHVEAINKIFNSMAPAKKGGRKSPKVAELQRVGKLGKKAIMQHFIDTIK